MTLALADVVDFRELGSPGFSGDGRDYSVAKDDAEKYFHDGSPIGEKCSR